MNFLKNLNIHSKGVYPANALSNFTAHKFYVDGIMCGSMEGFLQSLKFQDAAKQREVCKLTGAAAKEEGLKQDWKSRQKLYWQGQSYDRQHKSYKYLVTRAFNEMVKNPDFVKALKAADGYRLDHSIGVDDPTETVLTKAEFLYQLNRLRFKL